MRASPLLSPFDRIGSLVRYADYPSKWRFRVPDRQAVTKGPICRREQAPKYLLLSQRKCGTIPVGNQNVKPMKQKTDVLQGTLALMVLRTLDVLGPLHGYGIARRIEQISGDLLAVNQGTLYPVLL